MANLMDMSNHKTKWGINRWANEADRAAGRVYSDDEARNLFGIEQKTEIDGNILLNGGINALWSLATGTGGTKWDATNAYLGVGTSSAAEVATQTTLQANAVFVAMKSGFPTYGTSQLATWVADFDGSTANQSWQEFGVANTSGGTILLNRKCSNQSVKVSGQVWELTLTIQLS